ncbi:hypothetical protein CAPTEDRAFT_185997 [Capitella teleta]|uniref:G-protein coupled receptors family 1 profile domain-containing protein n=1 Tax=Capitella teleta TaxID=283909 RepID=R7VH51_CAPTE|nr:hypothetical protein CAPTEDRAFT_185997 [Capitella teleta]|eukprot:ELU17944.1 hypothetical protein CAPTEDRAFT_185997 [Capitella teleta]
MFHSLSLKMRLLIFLVVVAAAAAAENATDSDFYHQADTTQTNIQVRRDPINTRPNSRLIVTVTFYAYIVIGVLSVVCNGINIWVLHKQRTAAPYIYMTALAMSDMITGFCILLNNLMGERDLLSQNPWFSRMTYYLQLPTYFVRFSLWTFSTYLLNTLSIDRLIAVKFPMHHPIWCTSKRARIVSAVLLVISVALNSHFLPRYRILWAHHDGILVPTLNKSDFGRIPLVNTIASYLKVFHRQILPLVLMLITNIWTILLIVKAMKFRQSSTTSGGKQKVQCLGVTYGVITVFVVTNSPAAVNALSDIIDSNRRRVNITFLYLFELLNWIAQLFLIS